MKAALRRVPVEGVDILAAGVANEKRGVIGSQADPLSPAGGLANIFQAKHLLQLAIADPNSE
jgi:hypothetical protein